MPLGPLPRCIVRAGRTSASRPTAQPRVDARACRSAAAGWLASLVSSAALDSLQSLDRAAWPTYLDLGKAVAAESEVDAKVVLRQVAAAPSNLSVLRPACAPEVNSRSDRAAVRPRSLELENDLVARDVPLLRQHRGPLVLAVDERFEPAVVVDIGHGESPRRAALRDPGAG